MPHYRNFSPTTFKSLEQCVSIKALVFKPETGLNTNALWPFSVDGQGHFIPGKGKSF